MNPVSPEHSHRSRDEEYGEHQWPGLHSFGSGNTHASPVHEYPGFQFGSSQMMQPEQAYNMSIPPPYTSHQQLQPLIMPQWPSMLTSQSNYGSTPISSATTGTPISATSTSSVQSNTISTPATSASTGSGPRRTLTDADRKAMCLFHQENPTVKQTEIGAMFGVERSTVSKVLRLKDKFLNQEDVSQSPVKKSKNRIPDIERALLVWVQNQQKSGKSINDAALREKARQFALSVGNEEVQKKVNSSSWLERFKGRNSLGVPKSKKSTDSESTTVGDSSSSSTHTPSGISPISPGVISPGMSPNDAEQVRKVESSESFFDFVDRDRSDHAVYSGDTLPSLPASVTSPTSPFWPESSAPENFSPTNTLGKMDMPGGPPTLRPRSLTFPNLNLEPGALLNSAQGEEITPKYADRAMSIDAFESPVQDSPIAVNPLATMKRNNSAPSVKAELAMMHVTAIPPVPPVPRFDDRLASSPTHDDAVRALEMVMTFFRNRPGMNVDPQDYMTIGKLMEKLKLAQTSPMSSLPGGFHHVDDGDDSPRVKKKRSIRSL